jgi:hypothetical protein
MEDAIGRLFNQAVAIQGNPVISFIAKSAFAAVQKERVQRGAETLARRMARGKPWKFREDQVLAITFDYLRAAEAGKAQLNLEVMADLVTNGIAHEGLTEDDIRHLMEQVASLSFDEMRALAALVRAQELVREIDAESGSTLGVQQYTSAWKELAPGEETPPDDVYATFGALSRTGMVYHASTFGGICFCPTPKLAMLAALIDLKIMPG